MIKCSFVLAMVLGLVPSTIAQLITFEKEYYHNANDNTDNYYNFVQTADSGYLMGDYLRMLKIDKIGNLQWMKRFENPPYTLSAFSKFQNGYIATGTELIVKLDSVYNIEWLKIQNTVLNVPLITKIIECNGGLIFFGIIDLGGDAGIFVYKMDYQANIIWAKVYRYSTTAAEFPGDISLFSDNSMIISGRTDSLFLPNAFSDIILFKIDSVGNLIWSTRFKNTNPSEHINYGISHVATQDSGIALLAFTNKRTILIKTDNNGNMVWSKHYSSGTSSRSYSILEEQNRNLVFAGQFIGSDSIGYFERAFLIKTDSLGNLLNTRGYSGSRFNYAGCVKKTYDGGYGLSTACLNGWGNNSFGFIKTDSMGYTNNCGTDEPVFVETIPSLIQSNIAIFDSSISITLSNATYNAQNIGSVYTFCSSVSIDEIDALYNFTIVPNPSAAKFVLNLKSYSTGSIQILDLNGKFIDQFNIVNEKQINIDISSKCTPGIYFVKFISEDAVKTQKIVIF